VERREREPDVEKNGLHSLMSRLPRMLAEYIVEKRMMNLHPDPQFFPPNVMRQETSPLHGHYRPKPAREYSPNRSSDVRAQSRATTSGDYTQDLPPGEQRKE
jgi:hypothetical protein